MMQSVEDGAVVLTQFLVPCACCHPLGDDVKLLSLLTGMGLYFPSVLCTIETPK